MAGLSVGGLVSGLDTTSIIQQLTALEQAKVTREEKKKETAQKALDQFKELQTRLSNLASKASALESLNKFNVYKSTSSDEDYVTVSGKDGATSGKYEVTVKQLATTQKVYSNKITAINTPVVANDDLKKIFGETIATPQNPDDNTISIFLSKTDAAAKKDPNNPEVKITITKNDTLKDIVNKINSAEGAGVKASIMTMSDGDNRLVLTAVDTGTNGFRIRDNSAELGRDGSILEYLGVLSSSGEQAAASKNALLSKTGEIITGSDTFDNINTGMNKNTFEEEDVIGIYLPTNNGSGSAGWVTFKIHDGTNFRTIDDVLGDINTALDDAGAKFEAKLNEHGEIVIVGKGLEADQNFNSSVLKNVKIQMGTFKGDSATDISNGTYIISQKGSFEDVKKDMGTLSSRSLFANIINEGQNAIYTVDGMTFSSQSNDDDSVVSGTVFNLKKVTTDAKGPGTVKLSLDLDKDAIADSITALVEEFNSLMAFIDENAKAVVTEQTDKTTGKKTSVREVGCFTGDSNISSLQSNLKSMMTGLISELSHPQTLDGKPNPDYSGYYTSYSSAASIGITTQRDGTITVDKDKLLKALDLDIEGIRRLFTSNGFTDTQGYSVGNFTKNSTPGVYEIDPVTGQVNLKGHPGEYLKSTWTANIITLENGISFELPESVVSGTGKVTATFVRGIASQMTNFVEKAKDFVDGYYKTSEKTYQDRIDSIQKRVDDLQARVDKYNDRITKQFASLEKNIGNLQSQTANMLSALSSVSYSSK